MLESRKGRCRSHQHPQSWQWRRYVRGAKTSWLDENVKKADVSRPHWPLAAEAATAIDRLTSASPKKEAKEEDSTHETEEEPKYEDALPEQQHEVDPDIAPNDTPEDDPNAAEAPSLPAADPPESLHSNYSVSLVSNVVVSPTPERQLTEKQKAIIKLFKAEIETGQKLTMEQVQGKCSTTVVLSVLTYNRRRVKQIVNYVNYRIPSRPTADLQDLPGPSSPAVTDWLKDFNDHSTRSTGKKNSLGHLKIIKCFNGSLKVMTPLQAPSSSRSFAGKTPPSIQFWKGKGGQEPTTRSTRSGTANKCSVCNRTTKQSEIFVRDQNMHLGANPWGVPHRYSQSAFEMYTKKRKNKKNVYVCNLMYVCVCSSHSSPTLSWLRGLCAFMILLWGEARLKGLHCFN